MEEEMMRAGRRSEQQGGNPLFRVDRQRVGQSQSWQNGTAVIQRIRMRLEEARAPADDLLGEAIAEAFNQGFRDQVRENGMQVDDFSLQLVIPHNTGTHTWTRSPLMSLREWMEGGERARVWFDKLAKELNSSEGLDETGGEFYEEMLFVKKSRGSGRKGKKLNPGNLSCAEMLKKKRCVVQIKNKDQLCGARAIVTLKARVDENPQYHELVRGRWLQGLLAKQLHKEAGVPEGPCGRDEIAQFQRHLAPECQIIVMEGSQGLHWYKD